MKIKEEDGVAPSMGADAIADNPMPLGYKRKMFKVDNHVFRRFKSGLKLATEDWTSQLDENDKEQKELIDYATKYPNKTIILKDKTSGKLKAIRRNISK